jgi:ABC-type transport system substrate-binding protein
MRRLKGFSKLYLLAAAAVMVLALACSSAPAEEPEAPAEPEPAAPAPAQPEPAQPAEPQQPAQPAPAEPAPTVAAPAPAQPGPPGGAPSDVAVTLAAAEVTELFGDPPNSPYGTSPSEGQIGILDSLFKMENNDPMTPHLATSWEVAGDGNMLTLTIQEGIPFNTPPSVAGNDFGMVTAEDVAWNMNRQNAGVNENIRSGHGAQFAAVFGEATAVDNTTIEVPLVTPIFWGFPLSEFVIQDGDLALMSKKAHETLGPEGVKLLPVGSGAFVIGEWLPNNRGTVIAVPDHWDKTAEIGRFTVVQVPEITSRIAMMETGQAALGEMDFAQLGDIQERGLDFLPTMTEADTITAGLLWSGNLWTDVNGRTGEALEPWMSEAYAQDYPWIGCPWGDRCPYQDTNNPEGMSDMEQARLVRWALSYAMDREGVVEVLQGGLGTPIYLEYMGPLYPGWDPARTVTKAQVDTILEKYEGGTEFPEYGIDTPIPEEQWPWEIPWNIERAGELLDLAGFPMKADGSRFDISLNKYRCETGDVCLEQADAVAASWEQVGVRTQLLTEQYGAVVVPRMSERNQIWPVLKNCSVESAAWPLDWPPPPADTTYSRPSWGCAFESKFLDLMYKTINGEKDKAAREQMHMDLVDYTYYWQLYGGLSQVPRGVAYNPELVESWTARSTTSGPWHKPQFIVPAQ